jgi:hypothetical protein
MTLNNQPTSLNCPACGAPLDVDGTRAVIRCKFCGNVSLVPGVLPSQAAAPASALDEIRQLAGGNAADAIERYRQTYGVDQQEAREAIDALQAGRLVTPTAPGMRAPEELTRALEQVQKLLQAGNKIEAIKVYRQNFDVGLARAKFAIDQIEAGRGLQPETGFQALGRTTTVSQPSGSGSRAGGIIVLVVLLFVAGLIGFILLGSNGALGSHYIPENPVAMVPAAADGAPQIAGLFYNSNADTRFIGLVDPGSGKLLWQAAKLSGEGIPDAVISDTDMVYTANGTDLLAYHKNDGSLAWQAQMPDKLNYGASNLLVTGGQVITDNADQSIQAYDAGTGSPLWSKRLTGYDRTLRLMGSSLVVVDYTDSNNDYGLLFLDPVSGSQQTAITPTCTYNDYTSNIDPDAGFIYAPDENALYMIYDSSYGCVQRLDLASGKVTWTVNSKDSFSFSSDGFQYLMTDSTLYFSNSNDLLAVDKSSGNMKVLLTNPDYELLPLAQAGDTLIVRARRTRGTERFELWGVDAASGSPAWQKIMQGTSPIDPPNEMSGLIDDTDWGWTWHLTPAGLVLITFQGKPNQLVLETFNPADGTSLGKQTIGLPRISGDFYSIPTVIGWQGSIAYLSVESNIYMLDASTGKLKVGY